MKLIKISIGMLLAFLMGFVVVLWYQSFSRMQDEYVYALETSIVLFSTKPEKGSELSKSLNKLLLAHLNRFAVAKQYVPSFLVAEVEELFCGTFNINSEGMQGFSEVASTEVQQYLKHATNYCPYEGQI